MTTIFDSAQRYEGWLKAQLHGDLVADDLAKKHEKMRKSAFVFLRATYWRWAETVFDVCPDLADAASVLAVGDARDVARCRWAAGLGRQRFR